jgi:hypothetical protein
MKYRLKQAVIKMIGDNPRLYGELAHITNVTGPSFAMTLRRNGEDLTQKKVLETISKYTGLAESDLYELVTDLATSEA